MADGFAMTMLSGHVAVVAVGKIKTAYWQAAQTEYVARLQRYTDFKLVEVKDAVGRLPDNVAMVQEGDALLKASAEASRRILLTPTGQMWDSEGLARFLQKQIESYGRLAFLIGGPVGFAPEVMAASQQEMSLSRLTLPHELARVVVLEQLYRACTILNGEKYHK